MSGEKILDAILAGIILIVFGSALAPLLPINLVPLGWLFIVLGAFVAVAVVLAAVANALGGLSAR